MSKVKPELQPDREFSYIDISSIDNETNRIETPRQLLGREAPSRARQLVQAGDTVLSTVRTYLKNTAIVTPELDGAVASTGFCVLRPNQAVAPRFLLHRTLEADFVRELSQRQTGTSYPAVREADVGAMEIALPPLGEQHRIVAAIEEQFSRLDAGVASLQRARRNLARMRASLLNLAVDRHGGIVAPLGSSGLPAGWRAVQLGDVSSSVRNGVFVSRPDHQSSGVPILRISAVRPLRLDHADVRYAHDLSADDVRKYQLNEGDLLFTRYSGQPEYVGACARVLGFSRPTVHPDKLIRVVVDQRQLLPAFAEIAMAAGRSQAFIRSRRRTTAGQTGVSGSDIKQIPLVVPPLAVQMTIVNEMNRQLSIIDILTTTVDSNLTRAIVLRQSILREAFAGRLVPQGLTHAPADVLAAQTPGVAASHRQLNFDEVPTR